MTSAQGHGPVSSDAELLATFIDSGNGGAAACDLADRLLSRFGGLRQLLHADSAALLEEHGIGVSRLGCCLDSAGCASYSMLTALHSWRSTELAFPGWQ